MSSTEDAIYAAGIARGSVDGQSYSGGDDVLLLKYNSTGDKQWTKMMGASGSAYGYGVTANPFDGNVFVSGAAIGNLFGQTNAGNYDAFISKWFPQVFLVWQVTIAPLPIFECHNMPNWFLLPPRKPISNNVHIRKLLSCWIFFSISMCSRVILCHSFYSSDMHIWKLLPC